MKLLQLTWSLTQLIGICAASSPNISEHSTLAPRKGKHNGRECDYSDHYYVSWGDCITAAAQWCRAHAGQVVPLGQSISDGDVGGFIGTTQGYTSGFWRVKLTVKYQNDHFASGWEIAEDECNWYIAYIAQGCTPGGNKPTATVNQYSDGGTYYAPLMGSVDMKWVYAK